MNTLQWMMESPIGRLYLVASPKALCGIFWKRQPVAMATSLKGAGLEAQLLARTVKQLTEYFEGKRQAFDLKLELEGTDFQKRVWAELRRIPYGQTRSYTDIAGKIGNPKAVRAVGTANGCNPISIVVPCHRVIAANGSLGGYAGGIAIKTKLLAIEKQGVLRT